uniref:Serine/threonine protein phosphatase 7 long form isogeny n=1 Tax=Cajanus cajan TaxID=3821 RepID=A0A151QS46_CAJCA|nr:Serine/threonine protein phosphatase 7 long form isogeny [Cajanus cajan]
MLDGVVNPQAPRSFLGGPEDLSVLRNFSDHVATRLWSDEDRGELKIFNHGRKVKSFVIKHHQIQKLVDKSGLASLLLCNYQMVNKGLVFAFVERWHPETSSFHLPIGEMTITLDDVSCLLHLPIRGALFSQPVMDHDIACVYLEDLLGVSHKDAILEIRATRGAHVRMSWLRDVYDARCQEKRWEFATRAFLLFLVGCMIFANKSTTYVDVALLDLFRDLSACSDYAWGAATLTFLYEYLGDACVHSTKQIGGYMTLLQAWIFEHFPRIGSRQLSMEYLEQNPRASRWSHSKSIGHVLPYRKELDAIIINEVCWMPYSHHRYYRPFKDITLYSGWLRWGTYKQAHLPERVLRQYGHVQHIPRSPQHVTSMVISLEEIDDRWLHYANYVVDVAQSGSVNPICLICVLKG